MTFFLLVLQLAAAAINHPSAFTPGVVRGLTTTAICNTKWNEDRRHVTIRMKKEVFSAYGVPWSRRRYYEVDHLIPRSLGGADDVHNLWLQRWPEALKKDVLERRLFHDVCRGTLTLYAAQEQMRNWKDE